MLWLATCSDEKDLNIRGKFDQRSAKLLRISALACTDRQDCKTKDQIENYLDYVEFRVLQNVVRFDAGKSKTASIVREA